MLLSSPPCPAAALRAAAAYAAFEASSQGWLISRSAWSAASALQACGAASGWPSASCTYPIPFNKPAHAAPATSSSAPHSSGVGSGPWRCGEPNAVPPAQTHSNRPVAAGGAPWSPLTWAWGGWAAAEAAVPPDLHNGPPYSHSQRSTPLPPSHDAAAWSCPSRGSSALTLALAAVGRYHGVVTHPLPWLRSGVAEALRCVAGGGGGGGALALTARQTAPAAAAAAANASGKGALNGGRGGTAVAIRLELRCANSSTAAAAAADDDAGAPPSLPADSSAAQKSSSSSSSPSSSSSSSSSPALGFVSGGYDVGSFPPDRIRNFSIIAHVDHGKSTLADRLMEATGALGGRATHNAQYLDKLQVERERGITVKAQTVSLVYEHRGVPYLLNLIDTPGHVDFSYEVSRSLAACQGALLLVDAGQGIQAQTVANFYLAFEQGMDLIPVVNKIDLPAADPRGCAEQMQAAFDLDPAGVLFTSAKTGQGMEAVLPAVVERIRPPRGDPSAPLRMLLFDAFHDDYRGVVLLVEVVDGAVEVGMRVAMASNGAAYEVQEVGLQAPERHPTGRLLTGQVGYLLCGIKDLKAARVGDTLYAAAALTAAAAQQQQQQQQGGAAPAAPAAAPPRLPGFKPAKAMVFAGLFPLGGDGQEFESLATAMDKLLLNDASVVVKRENSEALGPGFRCGFLGMLHMEIFTQRLQHEYGASVVTTTPMVPYILEMPDGSTSTLESASEYPVDKKVAAILEPTVTATLIAPDAFLGRLMELCAGRRGEQLEHSSLGGGRTMLRYRLPLAELAGDFYSAVKSRSQGYASFDYEEGPYRPADLVRLDILAHSRPVDALARMVPRSEAAGVGRALLVKMRDALDRQQFEVVLQAAANGKIVARETIKALRKNVTAKCYGGDVTRKRKLLDRQKEGKRRMKRLGSIDVPQELFPELMKTR